MRTYRSLKIADFLGGVSFEGGTALTSKGSTLSSFERRTGLSVYDPDIGTLLRKYLNPDDAQKVALAFAKGLPPKITQTTKPETEKTVKTKIIDHPSRDSALDYPLLSEDFHLMPDKELVKHEVNYEKNEFDFVQPVVISAVHKNDLEILLLEKAHYKDGLISNLYPFLGSRVCIYSPETRLLETGSAFKFNKQDKFAVSVEPGRGKNEKAIARQKFPDISFGMKTPDAAFKDEIHGEVAYVYTFTIKELFSGLASVVRKAIAESDKYTDSITRVLRNGKESELLTPVEIDRMTRQNLTYFIRR